MNSINIDIVDLQNNTNNTEDINHILIQNYINKIQHNKKKKRYCKYLNIIIILFILLILLQIFFIYKFNINYINSILYKLKYNTYYKNSNRVSNSVVNSNNFDYYLFAQTFPLTFCKIHKCSGIINKKFIIHGLWPNYNDGSYPTFCSKEELDYTFVNNNKNLFLKYWSDSDDFIDYSFINHEWTKHGTCSNGTIIHSQEDYFNNIFKIRENIDIYDILKKNNIINNNRNYGKDTLINIIKNNLNVTPKFDCIKYNNKYILSGIYLGYNKDLKLINIPSSNDFNCPNNFYYINEDFI